MPARDLSPDEWEDLVDSDHCCDERCTGARHVDASVDASDDPLATALALLECGLGGSDGNFNGAAITSMLWRQARELVGLPTRSPDKGELAIIGAKYDELLEEWLADLRTRDVLRRAQEATARAVRVDRRSPNRPTRVEVDPEAWDLVKRDAIANGRRVAEAVGTLHSAARPLRRFARLFIDDAQWLTLRVIAADSGVTVSRLIGVIVEREATRLGWTPGGDR
jgi:hypothetical protein